MQKLLARIGQPRGKFTMISNIADSIPLRAEHPQLLWRSAQHHLAGLGTLWLSHGLFLSCTKL